MTKLKPEDIKYLIIHHSATHRDTTTFPSIKNYHTRTLGYEDIGYHYVITGDGRIYNGRSEEYVGAHCKTSGPANNLSSLGICLTGNFETEKPSAAQLGTLWALLGNLIPAYKIDLNNVLGHCEAPGTSTLCPGKNLLSWLKDYRVNYKKITNDELVIELGAIVYQIQELIRKLKGP